MSDIQLDIIQLDNGRNMLVQVIDIDLPKNLQEKVQNKSSISDMPTGAEGIGIMDNVKTSMSLVKDDMKSIANSLKDVLLECSADEFSLEVSIGFAGKGAIPFIASAESNAGIKLKATWKKDS